MPEMSQRDYMRMLYRRYNGNEERIIEAYASAEMNGEVLRMNNTYNLSPIQYARRLYKDGISKEWIFNSE